MKKMFVPALVTAFVIFSSCGGNTETKDAHTHEDGSTHQDHDTTRPVQQEFNVADSVKQDTGVHIHTDGTKHTHDDKAKDKHD